ncbi:MAG: Lrp/AsnC family transcriptional regulator [Bacillota bacterium]
MNNNLDKEIIKRLQEDFPLERQPYKKLAKEIQIPEEKLMEKLHEFMDKGILKRVGAILRHRKVGYNANAMVVWNIPVEKVEGAAEIMISYPMLSHCYEREATDEWPYNTYTMIHCENTDECEKIVSEIIDKIGEYEYEILYSTEELKKTSVKYFNESYL